MDRLVDRPMDWVGHNSLWGMIDYSQMVPMAGSTYHLRMLSHHPWAEGVQNHERVHQLILDAVDFAAPPSIPT